MAKIVTHLVLKVQRRARGPFVPLRSHDASADPQTIADDFLAARVLEINRARASGGERPVFRCYRQTATQPEDDGPVAMSLVQVNLDGSSTPSPEPKTAA